MLKTSVTVSRWNKWELVLAGLIAMKSFQWKCLIRKLAHVRLTMNPTKKGIKTMTHVWHNNEIQFARLLCELVANCDSLEHVLVAESMDITLDELQSLYDRANAVWKNKRPKYSSSSVTL